MSRDEPRIGFFICHCGENIAGKVDVKEVAEYASQLPGVVYSTDNMFMCSTEGTNLIKEKIEEFGLDRTIVASCSVRQHGPTFMKVLSEMGINPYFHEQVNIREQCSWCTDDPEEATEKAKALVRGAVMRSRLAEPVERKRIDVVPAALVIGGGVAGMTAARDIADRGIKTYVVEREPSVGGHMTMLNKTFPTDECPMCSEAPLLNAVRDNPNVELYTLAEVVGVKGTMGDYHVTIRQKPRYVDPLKCTSCGVCAEHCPVEVENEWDRGFGIRKAIYKPFPQAIPATFLIDDEHCIRCETCSYVCPPKAIDRSQTERTIEVDVGTIVVATGYEEYDPSEIEPYGYGRYENVITQLQLERMLSPVSLTEGHITRPSDGKVPKSVAIINCVGSRNEQVGNAYCTGVCCMFSIKNAKILKEHIPDANVYVFYIDIRTPGLNYEEYYKGAQRQGIQFIRGRPGEITEDPVSKNLIVRAEDTLRGRPIEVEADLVVLSAAMVPPKGVGKVAHKLGLLRGKEGFFKELHIKMAPVDSNKAGIFLAGSAQGPKDITTSVAHARGAASAASIPLEKGYVEKDLITAVIDPELCTECMACVAVCPASAIEVVEQEVEDDGRMQVRKTLRVNDAACIGGGTCVPACPTGAIQLRTFRDEQLEAQLEGILSHREVST
ncbi:CoB--CoM heterodisulfide reductase iron-sulfur subunit A family protein [Methermicoccus shengliensis]|uniref:CoB--CoM heterodisulfide reductase iron-sulfur subunit A n=1 Tax=Methermicoccus shengliensis TaxID=660064 RepID=A0A832RXB8_9EURY|nr:CoB--CoM heterodisulfide reductase iron-sulfur subunit A family protein [Methermicoccus shengliensis]KUK05198.1 MAG: CoB--CoM heterodisulfide reductase iron-sulfur subunit A 1 [Euryarchaeota archaeon 55_53]KUK30817.1 MAG: CoB--CoM heterodisulfide reductase iron-sulfur subunit A 1 [Methanosarcinales archeaon 56_1174]MDI3487358.1 heterodisulfide reductase subunit [Methanosarcinales archaeon]MDN5294568.1 heterodisulfide reductase subunit [Methanosarcinales archaeon]HIH69702.1 CoB--CoM heterodi